MSICDTVGEFADGEMQEQEAERFREHLTVCQHCPSELRKILELQAIISQLPTKIITLVAPDFPEWWWKWSWRWFRWEVHSLGEYTFRTGKYLYGIEPGMGDP